jgi:hypothetical protein
VSQAAARTISWRSRFVRAITLLVCLLAYAPALSAQGFEITPVGGYRFGGDFFELLSGKPLDIDGAPAVGVVVNVPTSDLFQIEALYSHQRANALVPIFPSGPPVNWQFTVDHWQGGGLQEYDIGRPKVRPFLTGTLGLTRYAANGDNEIRFTLGAGGGVKLFPVRHVGVRLDGRLFMTFVDADVALFGCSTFGPNTGCIIGFNTNIVWQAEFTAGLVVKFN